MTRDQFATFHDAFATKHPGATNYTGLFGFNHGRVQLQLMPAEGGAVQCYIVSQVEAEGFGFAVYERPLMYETTYEERPRPDERTVPAELVSIFREAASIGLSITVNYGSGWEQGLTPKATQELQAPDGPAWKES
jgi:hypothetical protein